MFYEIWRSGEDWDKHMAMPYLKAWFEKSAEVCEKIDLSIWERVEMPTNPIFRGEKTPADQKEKYTLLALNGAKERDEGRVWKEIIGLIPHTHIEPGCIGYDMHVNLDMNTMARNPRKLCSMKTSTTLRSGSSNT